MLGGVLLLLQAPARRVVKHLRDAPDLKVVLSDFDDDFGVPFHVAHVPDGFVSFSYGPPGTPSHQDETGTVYDGTRIFNLHNQFSDSVTEASGFIEADHLATTLQRFGRECAHTADECDPSLRT